MTADDRWDRIKDLVADALERDAAEREAWLDAACGDDVAVRARVDALLRLEAPASSFLETSAEIDLPDVVPTSPTTPPATVGRYTVKQRIAVGGAGSVYEAVQEQPHRTVALKLLRADVHSEALARRFELESEVLAHLHHPAIAHVYEAGVYDDGPFRVPWIAMELVRDARTITAYAEEHELSATDRVELFISVCRAVQHGHERGIVHRDLKPANILVDHAGHPKVIDFGVARVIREGQLRDLTLQTSVGDIIGTLPYMSPEQCGTDPEAVDVRADVYALGVVLFEMLTGRLPLVLAGLPLEQAIHAIRTTPPKRLGRIRPELGDLDAITAKCLEKEKGRRYGTAAALAADCRRYIDHQPVVARPPSVLYQATRFARRHRVAVTAGVLILAMMLTASLVSLSFALSEGRQRQTAERISDHLETMLTLPDPHRHDEDITVVEMLDLMVQRLDTDTGELPEVESRVRHAIGATYMDLGRFEQSERQLRRAVQLQREVAPGSVTLAHALNSLGISIKEGGGDPVDAEQFYREALEIHARRSDPTLETDTVMSNLTTVLVDQGKLAEASAMLTSIIEHRRADPETSLIIVVSDLRRLGRMYRELKDPVESERTLQEAIDAMGDEIPPTHPIYAATLGDLGQARSDAGDLDGAREAFAEAWTWCDGARPVGSPDWNITLRRYVDSLQALEQMVEARAVLTHAAQRLSETFGPDATQTREVREWLDGFSPPS